MAKELRVPLFAAMMRKMNNNNGKAPLRQDKTNIPQKYTINAILRIFMLLHTKYNRHNSYYKVSTFIVCSSILASWQIMRADQRPLMPDSVNTSMVLNKNLSNCP